MSPERPSAPNTEPVQLMDYARIANAAILTEIPRNVEVLRHELLRRSAEQGVKDDPAYQHAWEIVESRMLSLANES